MTPPFLSGLWSFRFRAGPLKTRPGITQLNLRLRRNGYLCGANHTVTNLEAGPRYHGHVVRFHLIGGLLQYRLVHVRVEDRPHRRVVPTPDGSAFPRAWCGDGRERPVREVIRERLRYVHEPATAW